VRVENHERFRYLFAQASIGIALETLDGRILEVNPAFCALMGYTLEEMQSLSCSRISHPQDEEIEKVLFEILEISERELRRSSLDDVRRAIAASIACRAAIKINMKLDPAKIDWLLTALARTQCPMSCPHGRPIALRYSTRDILKSFHRI
jgi:DNA mismatch repair ATPase MutL